MKHSQFKRSTFVLFAVVAMVPSLIVGAAWYTADQLGVVNVADPTIFTIIGSALVAAVTLSFIFASLLTGPIKRIHEAALALAGGHYNRHTGRHPSGEFAETLEALGRASELLQLTQSETASEMSLIEAERNKLRGVLNSMSDGVFALDRDGRIILFNHAAIALTGRPIEAVAGQLAEKVMPFRKDGELVMTRWLDSQLGTDHKRGEWKGLELYRADGDSLFVDVQAITLNEDPNGIRALITFHDLTEEHKLEEMKVDFVALAAHELRTPITEIRGYLDIMQHEPIGLRPTGRELVNHAALAVSRLSGLVNNLLGVARIEHGEVNYYLEPTDWGSFLKAFKPELTERARQNNRKFSLKIAAKLPTVMIDPMSMREVINNLIDNAIEHTEPKTGTIEIIARLRDHEIETSVIDNGSGIPPEAIKHLFTKFFRYEGLKSTHGTGLGLYISKSIVEGHGGYIWVESHVDEGSAFSFRLPTKTKLAGQHPTSDTTNVTRGTHGWIKNNSLR